VSSSTSSLDSDSLPTSTLPLLLNPPEYGLLRCVGNAVVGEEDHDESGEILLPIPQIDQRRFQSIRTVNLMETKG
jgi:hypothetical protein